MTINEQLPLDDDLQASLNAEMAQALIHQFTLSRREALGKGFAGVGGLLSLTLLGQACKSTSSNVAASNVPANMPSSFLAHVKATEDANPLPETLLDPKFKAAAAARGTAIAKVIGFWLATRPYAMFQELQDQPEGQMPIFIRYLGPTTAPVVAAAPIIVFRHQHVMTALEANGKYTVDPYAGEMRRGTEGQFDKTKMGHFILGTDDPQLYDADAMILRSVLRPTDITLLRQIIRKASMAHVQAAKASGKGEFDAVATLCRYVPISVCSEYLGMPTFEANETWIVDGQTKGGGEFEIAAELKKTFTFEKIVKGKVPTATDLYHWIKGSFRNIFNNIARDANFQAEGIESTEYMIAYLYEMVKYYKGKMQAGAQVPDTMLTRLLDLQLKATKGQLDPKDFGLESPADLLSRLTDARIRENVFGTVTGAGVNPEEGMARVIDALLSLKEGTPLDSLNGKPITLAPGATVNYNLAVEAAQMSAAGKNEANAMKTLNAFMLELLRLNPQGEVVLRMCTVQNELLGNVLVPKGTLTFVAHGAAMRDPKVVKDPLQFNSERDPMQKKWAQGLDTRANEIPQSQLYLQHGYGRHKCLGRYASELTMEEGLRAMLLLGDISRGSELKMDGQKLYADSLIVKFT